MSAPYRTIAPASAGKRSGPQRKPPEPDTRQLRRRPLVSAACRPCQRRKTKCDGGRPTCSSCDSAALECEWDTEPGLTRGASLRIRNGKLEGALATVLEAFWYLQTKPVDEARQVLDQIRASSDVSAVFEYLNTQKQIGAKQQHGQMAWQALGLAQQEPVAAIVESGSKRPELAPTTSGSSKASVSFRSSNDEDLPQDQSVHHGGDAYLIVLGHKDTISGLKAGVKAFGLYAGVVFHVFEHQELEELAHEVLEALSKEGSDWILKAPESESLRRRSMLAELCAAAALGLQYNDEPFNETPTITADVPGLISDADELLRTLYRISKSFMDDVIQYSPYRALKLCALFGIFNVIEASSVALAYTESGLSFALNYGLFGPLPPAGMNRSDFISNRKVLRTLAGLRSWLTATLGYLPGTGIDARLQDLQIAGEIEDTSPEGLIQRKVMEVTVVAANLVRVASSFTMLSSPVLKDIGTDLSRWDKGLDNELQLEVMMRRPGPLPSWYLVGFYMHLLHQSVSVLKARTVHANQQTAPASFAQAEMRTAVVGGIEAARTASRIMERMLNEQIVFRKSWMSISTAYCSATTLLWCSSQAMLFEQPQKLWLHDLQRAAVCLQLLDYCAPRHSIAQIFQKALRPHSEAIQAVASAMIGEEMDITPSGSHNDPSVPIDYLFMPATGQSRLHKTNMDLHSILGRPFSSDAQGGVPSTMHASENARLNAHVNWTKYVTSIFNGEIREQLRGDEIEDKVLKDSINMLGAGYFVDSREPHGWRGLSA